MSGSLERNAGVDVLYVSRLESLVFLWRRCVYGGSGKASPFRMFPTVEISGSLARKARFGAPTCLVSSLRFPGGFAVSMGEAATPLLCDGCHAGCHVVLRGRRGTLWQSNLFDNVSKVWKLEEVSHEMLVFDAPTCLVSSLWFPVASPCLWGKLQNLSFSKVSKQVVMSFCVGGVALSDIPTCLITCRKFFCVGWGQQCTPHFTLNTLHSTLHHTLHFTHSTLLTPHFTLHTPHSTLYTFHSTLYTLHSTLYTLHSSLLYTLHSTLYTLDCTLLAPHFTLLTPHSTLHTPHSTLHTLHSTLYTLHTLHSPLHTLHSSLHTLHSTLHTLHSTLHTLHFTLYSPHSTLHTLPLSTLHSILYTLHFTLYTLHFTLCTLHISTLYTPHTLLFRLYTPRSTLYTPHSTLHTLHSRLYTPHSTLYTPHSTLYTPHSTLYTLHFYTLPFALYTPHSTLYTLHTLHSPIPHSTLYTPHSLLYTPHSTLHTFQSTLQTGNRGNMYKTVQINDCRKVFCVTAYIYIMCFDICTTNIRVSIRFVGCILFPIIIQWFIPAKTAIFSGIQKLSNVFFTGLVCLDTSRLLHSHHPPCRLLGMLQVIRRQGQDRPSRHDSGNPVAETLVPCWPNIAKIMSSRWSKLAKYDGTLCLAQPFMGKSIEKGDGIKFVENDN